MLRPLREVVARAVDALRGDPRRQLVAVPLAHRAVRLHADVRDDVRRVGLFERVRRRREARREIAGLLRLPLAHVAAREHLAAPCRPAPASTLMTCGSTSYSTLISRAASIACSSVSAATAATSSPWNITTVGLCSSGGSRMDERRLERRARAARPTRSTDTTRACGYGERTMRAVEHAGTRDVERVLRAAGDLVGTVEALDATCRATVARGRPVVFRIDGRCGGRRGRLGRLSRAPPRPPPVAAVPAAARSRAQPRCTPFTLDTASKMRENVPQRQMLPSRPFLICSGVGFGCFSSRPTLAMMKPGVQKPHISASLSQNACCTGCSVSPLARPVDVADLLALHFDRERRAGIDRAAVDEHRAGAAGAAIAAALVAGQVGAHAQRVEQRDARLDHQIELPAVDGQPHRHLAGPDRGRPALRLELGRRDDRGRHTDDAGRFQEVAAAEVDAVRRVILRSHSQVLFWLVRST